ncbi:MAG: SMP-30/gluconolactonase/LRE family protein [Rhizobiaceae bacterium]|nr:SMP-30/gluconolactonase/LRE family protein [Rhizobiaceae bacterium]
MKASVETVVPCDDIAGETPLWSVEEKAIYWIDVVRPRIHRFEPATGKMETMDLNETIGSIGLRGPRKLVAAMRTGFYLVDFDSRALEHLFDPEPGLPDNTLNDGRVDRRGRFWSGSGWYGTDDVESESTRLPTEPTAALYRLGADRQVHRMLDGLSETNTLAWSPDNKTMYVGDSGPGVIYAFDYDIDNGAISNRREFARTKQGDMFHDGSAIDSEGYLWSAIWNGWRIRRYAPDGSIDREIELPVQRPTACCFGGPDLSTLFVTTATWTLSDEAIGAQPLAGSLLCFETGIRGMSEACYKG